MSLSIASKDFSCVKYAVIGQTTAYLTPEPIAVSLPIVVSFDIGQFTQIVTLSVSGFLSKTPPVEQLQ